MRRVSIGVGLAAGGLIVALLLWGPWGASPGDVEVHQRLLARPDMAPYAKARAHILPLTPENLPGLAAEQPAVYGNLTSSSGLYRVEFYTPSGDAVLLIYDAGNDRVLRTFNLLSGRLE
ncbi:MAG: hypothetical protein QXO51_08385 [Halobacteria archaeon]